MADHLRLRLGGPRADKSGRVWANLLRALRDEDRPRPGANQFGAGSPFTLLGVREDSSMPYLPQLSSDALGTRTPSVGAEL